MRCIVVFAAHFPYVWWSIFSAFLMFYIAVYFKPIFLMCCFIVRCLQRIFSNLLFCGLLQCFFLMCCVAVHFQRVFLICCVVVSKVHWSIVLCCCLFNANFYCVEVHFQCIFFVSYCSSFSAHFSYVLFCGPLSFSAFFLMFCVVVHFYFLFLMCCISVHLQRIFLICCFELFTAHFFECVVFWSQCVLLNAVHLLSSWLRCFHNFLCFALLYVFS